MATWRCSTKKRAVLCVFSIISVSPLWAMVFSDPSSLVGERVKYSARPLAGKPEAFRRAGRQSRSSPPAGDSPPSRDDLHLLPVLHHRGSVDDDPLPPRSPLRHTDGVAMGLTHLPVANVREGLTIPLVHHIHREPIGVFGGADHGTQRDDENGLVQRSCGHRHSSNHAHLELVARIGDGDLYREDSALRICRGRNGRNPALKLARN